MSISVKNISSAKVNLSIPDIRFNRSLMPGRVITLTEEEYKEFVQEPGCRNLLNGHYIKVTGVEEDRAVEEIDNVFETDDIAAMLDALDITAFAKFIPRATAAEKETVIKLHKFICLDQPSFKRELVQEILVSFNGNLIKNTELKY